MHIVSKIHSWILDCSIYTYKHIEEELNCHPTIAKEKKN